MKVALKQSAMPSSPTANQDFTDAVFSSDVKAAIVSLCRGITNDTIIDQMGLSIGIMDGSANQANLSIHDADNVGTATDCRRSLIDGQIAGLEDAVGNNSIAESVGSVLSNGVRAAWSDWNANELVNALIIGGSDVEASVVAATLNGTTDVTVAHGLSAAPQVLIALTHWDTATPNNFGAHGCIGFYDVGNSTYRCVTTLHPNGSTTTSIAQMIGTDAILIEHNQTVAVWKATINTVGATNFNVKADAATTDLVKFLCLRVTGGAFKVGEFLTKTTTGTQADITGMAAKPKLALYLPTYLTAADGLDTVINSVTCEAFGFGAACDNEGVTEEGCISVWANDGVTLGVTDTKSLISQKAGITINTTGGLGIAWATSSWDAGGITNNYSTVSGTARYVVYLAIAPASSLDPIRLVWRQ